MARVPAIAPRIDRAWRARRVRQLHYELARLRRLDGPVLRRDLAEGALVALAVLTGLGALVTLAPPWPVFVGLLPFVAWLLWRAGRRLAFLVVMLDGAVSLTSGWGSPGLTPVTTRRGEKLDRMIARRREELRRLEEEPS